MFYDLADVSRKLQRITIANITGQVQLKGQNMVLGHPFAEKVILEQCVQQIGLTAAANTCDDLHLTIPHKGDELAQIAFPFYFHSPTSVENLPILSYNYSMDIIHHFGRKSRSPLKCSWIYQITFQ